MQKFKQFVRRIADASEGQSMAEYAAVLSVVALVAIAGFALLPGPIVNVVNSVAVLLP